MAGNFNNLLELGLGDGGSDWERNSHHGKRQTKEWLAGVAAKPDAGQAQAESNTQSTAPITAPIPRGPAIPGSVRGKAQRIVDLPALHLPLGRLLAYAPEINPAGFT